MDYEYDHETDTLNLYFVKVVPGLIDNTDDVLAGFLVDYSTEGKIVTFEIMMASEHIQSHFWDTGTDVRRSPPLCLHAVYSQAADTLTVSFVDSPQPCRGVSTEDDRIVIWTDSADNWERVVISGAMESVAN